MLLRRLRDPTFHVAISNSITICRAWTPAALSSIVGCSQHTSNALKLQVRCDRYSSRTDDRFAIIVDLECTFSVTDDERKIEKIFHRLRKVVWIYDEFEKIDRASVFKNIFYLRPELAM